MHDLAENSIKLYECNPLFLKIDMSNVPFSEMAKVIRKISKNKNPYPETDALRFYLYNHGFHLIKQKYNGLSELPPDITDFVKVHIKSTTEIGKRMLAHTIVSTICEMDYLDNQGDPYYQTLSDSYGEDFSKFMKKIHDTNRWNDFDNLKSTCGQLTSGLVSAFAFSDWAYKKPWTRICSLPSQCISGDISLESFTDQSFSLTHWGGSILNKCHLYQCCTDVLYHLLDVQDSGQIPQWINKNMNSKYVSSEIKEMYNILKKHFPNEMTGDINNSLISNSKKKREAYKTQINNWVNNAFSNGNGGTAPTNRNTPLTAMEKTNNILMGGQPKGI